MSGWTATQNWTPGLIATAGVAAALALTTAVVWSDSAGLTRSPLCGAACHDAKIADALRASPADFAAAYPAAQAAAQAQINAAPYDTGAWLRLAMLEVREADGRLSPAALKALETSYERAPVDATVANWRIPLVFDLWSQAPFDLRQSASNEVKVLHNAAPETQLALRRLIGRMNTLEGRFAYRLHIEALDDAYYRADGRDTPSPIPRP